MDSWWDLAEWSGYHGTDLATHDIACAFCSVRGKWALQHHSEKANTRGKKLNYDILKCENCGNLQMAFWATGGTMHDKRIVPWPLRVDDHPKSWPEDVGRFYIQAKRAAGDKNWDSAAVMARSALQLALRHKEAKGKDLFHEIDDLAMKGDLPPLMKEWSHEVRMLARDPAHPAPGQPATTPREVADVLRFLEFLLRYLFTLPHEIAEFRTRKSSAD